MSEFELPTFRDEEDPSFVWVWDGSSKSYVRVADHGHPDRSHASGGDNELFDPAVHTEHAMNPLQEGILASFDAHECQRCGSPLNTDGLCTICDRGLFNETAPQNLRTAPFPDRVPKPNSLKTDISFPSQTSAYNPQTDPAWISCPNCGQNDIADSALPNGKQDLYGGRAYMKNCRGCGHYFDPDEEAGNLTIPTEWDQAKGDSTDPRMGKTANYEVGQFVVDMDGNLHYEPGSGADVSRIKTRDNISKSGCEGVVHADGIAKVTIVHPGFIPEPGSIEAQLAEAFGEAVTLAPLPDHMKSAAHPAVKNEMKPTKNEFRTFAHVDDEMEFLANNPETLDQCPECGDVMVPGAKEASCHSCGHRQPVLYTTAGMGEMLMAAPLLAIPGVGEAAEGAAMADTAAGAAGAAGMAGGAGGSAGMGKLMTKALQGGAFRGGENAVGGGQGQGQPEAAPVSNMPEPGVVTHLIHAGVIESAGSFGEKEVGVANKNRGEDVNPALKGTQGFNEEVGSQPEILKGVNDGGGSSEGDEKTQGGGHQEEATKAFEMNLPLIMEFADSDEAGIDHPILKALDELLERAFPGYKNGEGDSMHTPGNPEGTPEGSESHSEEHEEDQGSSEHHKSKTAAEPAYDPWAAGEYGQPEQQAGDWEDDQAMGAGAQDESEKVRQWQYEQLAQQGFTPEQIEQIMQGDMSQGHHLFTDLTNQGASPQDAMAIREPDAFGRRAMAEEDVPNEHLGWTQQQQAVPPINQLPGAVPGSVPPGVPPPPPGGLSPSGISPMQPNGQTPGGLPVAAPPCPGCGQAHAPGTPCSVNPTDPTSIGQQVMPQQAVASLWRVVGDFDAAHDHGQGHAHPSAGAGDTSDHDHGAGSHPGHEWTDETGQPLQEGQDYEMVSPNYAIPDRVRIDRILPDKLTFTVKTDLMDYQDEMTKEDQANEGYNFTTSARPDSTGGFDQGHQELPPRPGQDGSPQVDDLSDSATVVSHELDSTFGWLLEDDDPIAINPDIYAQVMGATGFGSGSRQLPEARYAGKDYSPREQREFIDEPGTARNLDSLDLRDTHYPDEDEIESNFLW